MGNSTGKQIGNFQADVGRADSTMGLIFAYITAGIMILIAIILTISAFIPQKDQTCKDDPFQQKPCPKKRNYALLWGLILIPIAILIVYVTKYWNHLVMTNKNVAIADGTMAEANWFSNLFNNLFNNKN